MPELTWEDMQKNCPNAHLIVAVVPPQEGPVTPSALKLRTELLVRLARYLQLRGAYAIADFPEDDIRSDVRCIVEHAEEAAALAEILKAEESDDHPEYASHRPFAATIKRLRRSKLACEKRTS